MTILFLPRPGTAWTHRNGHRYRVITVANLTALDPKRFPPTVVYQDFDENIWCRPLDEWHERMRDESAGAPVKAVDGTQGKTRVQK